VAEMPIIDKEKCNGCALCVSVCRCGALVLRDNVVVVIETEECSWCTDCEAVCPTEAIRCPFEIVIERP
jgi:NAD-dependent dihydropyrimidine dehydrogenase PreA subunit